MASSLRCPKCNEPCLSKDSRAQSRICGHCGHVVRGSKETHLLIQANGVEIAKDYLAIGLTDTMHKWSISASALYRIPEVRELKGKYRKLMFKRNRKEIDSGNNGNSPTLPSLPVFDDKWNQEIQLKWFNIYEQILGRQNGK